MENAIVTAATIGTLVALILEWFPGLAPKWAALTETKKRIYVGLIVLAVNTLAILGTCAGYLSVSECPAGGWQVVVNWFISGVFALVTSQGVHQATKRPATA